MSELESRLAREAGSAVARCRPIGGEHGARHYRASLADGRDLFVKEASGEAGRAALAAETRGLRWLSEAAAVPIPAMIAAQDGLLALAWVQPATPDREASERFGRDLARLHAAGVGAGSGAGGEAGVAPSGRPRFGAPWSGFIASLALPNTEADEWPRWYAENRLLPYLRLARDSGALGAKDSALVESVASRVGELAGPAEPPSRIHGDLWSGNLMWSTGRGWLIDPAAHGGHRETDLAMLALFGAPFLDRILAAYRDVTPLADGWKNRVPLHQLHPLLVHVCLFGRAYRESTLAAARAALRA